MTWALDIFLIIAVLVWLVEQGVNGVLSPEQVAVALLLLVVALAITRALRQTWARRFFDIAVPAAILMTFVVWHAEGDWGAVGELSGAILALLIAVFGIYIMIVKGLGGRGGRGKD